MKQHSTACFSAIAILGFAFAASDAVAQTAKDLQGTWMNVSNVNIRPDGSRVDMFGCPPGCMPCKMLPGSPI